MPTWMNEYEIDRAVMVLEARAPDLHPFARLLADWRDTVNSHSDGWAYWKGGTRPAGRLMDLVQAAVAKIEFGRGDELPTTEQMRRALPPIRGAATRHGMPFPEIVPAASVRRP